MATNIERALYPDTQGMGEGADAPVAQAADVEVEIEHLADGGVTIQFGEDPTDTGDIPFDANLAEYMDAGELLTLASDLITSIGDDEMGRADWERTYKKGLELLGLKIEERTTPWAGACSVASPLITEAVVRFQSETVTETFPARGPVRTRILGRETPAKKEAAARIEEDMNYQLTERMTEFRPEHERLLWSLPAAGSAFKKVYDDPNLGRPTSIFVPAEDVLLPYGVSDINTACPRLTHRMRCTKNDFKKYVANSFYRDVSLPDPTRTSTDIQDAKDRQTGFSSINDDRYTFYEVVTEIDLPGFEDMNAACECTGIARPYIITIDKDSSEVLAIRRNWKEGDKLFRARQHFVHYQYIPGFGAYGFGLFHLIGGYARAATSILRQLVDAGTLSNLPGGLKARGLRIKQEDDPIAPGEFRDVDAPSGDIKNNILPLPYKEPSMVLAGLLDKIIEEGRRFASAGDLKVSDMSAQAPVGTTLALLERQLKVMTAVQARVHFALKQELKLIAGLIRDSADDTYAFEPEIGQARARGADYDVVEIIPVSDPNAATMSQRVVQYQAVVQMSQMAPEIYDLPQLHRGMLDVLGIKNAAKLIPLPEDMTPVDPVSENAQVLRSKPVKAFRHQDHEAHIAIHTAMTQDPMLMQVMGQNPKMQVMMQALQSHIAEHVAYRYMHQIEAATGIPMLPLDSTDDSNKMPPEVEFRLSQALVNASGQVLQLAQAQAAQQAAQAAAQDPLVQMQQQELQLKGQELQIKDFTAKSKSDVDHRKLALEEQKLQGAMHLDGVKTGIQAQQVRNQAAAAANKPPNGAH